MIKLKHLLLESESRSLPITGEDVKKLITTSFKNNYHRLIGEGVNYYRGVKNHNGSYFLSDPKGSFRKSKNNSNYVNNLLTVMPEWQQYPDRTSSIVFSTNRDDAEQYGNPFFIIPEDGSKIALAPSYDFIYSFKGVRFDAIEELLMSLKIVDNSGINLVKSLRQVESEEALEAYQQCGFDDGDLRGLEDMLTKQSYNLYECLQRLLSPNGFSVNNQINWNPGVEGWTDGRCLMIEYGERYNKANIALKGSELLKIMIWEIL